MNPKKILTIFAVPGILFLGGCMATLYYGGTGYYGAATYGYGYRPSIYTNYDYRYQPSYYGSQSYIGGYTYYDSGHRHGGHKHIHGGHRHNGGGHNTPVEDIGEEAIEEVIIVDENDISTLG
jgi:hypothetical protein